MNIIKEIKQRRNLKTQKQVAEFLGVSTSLVNSVECGARSDKTIKDKIRKIRIKSEISIAMALIRESKFTKNKWVSDRFLSIAHLKLYTILRLIK